VISARASELKCVVGTSFWELQFLQSGEYHQHEVGRHGGHIFSSLSTSKSEVQVRQEARCNSIMHMVTESRTGSV
jgi:hypothetical protein